MRIKRFQLECYGPFENSGWVDLSPTMNIFVGENNAGKSSVLRSFLPSLPPLPHRNSSEWRSGYLGTPKQTVEIEYSGAEIDRALRKVQGAGMTWFLGSPELQSEQAIRIFLQDYLKNPKIENFMTRGPDAEFSLMTPTPTGPVVNIFSISSESAGLSVVPHGRGGATSSIFQILSWLWREKIFVFEGLRASPAKMNYASPSRLDPNASRLAVELSGLQGDSPELFSRLVSHLTSIFPTVGNLSVSPSGGEFEIRVWATREQRIRDLSFSLDDSGTGLAQAIAILFVAMTFESSVIVIDEISSYLHPAAAKALLRILQSNYPRHQYIISTHSPEVLTAGREAKVFWVRKYGFESTVVEVDLRKLEVLREVTGQLGISMTDVFAAEHIVWVDGETEELCFPMLLEESGDTTRSVLFIAILHTGDFQDRKVNPEKVFRVYERLTSATAPVISKVAFNFDSDDLTQTKKEDLMSRSGGRIHFLPRRNFESYLLHPPAIARVVVEALKEHETLEEEVVEERTRGALAGLAADKRYGEPANPPSYSDPGWLNRVDGAKLISDLFLEVTDQKLEYRKTTHSVALVKDLLGHSPDFLNDLTTYVKELVATARQ